MHVTELHFPFSLHFSGNVELNPCPNSVTFTHLNIRSIRNKSPSLLNELITNPADILSLNETWLSPSDSTAFVESLIPLGYSILNPRRNWRRCRYNFQVSSQNVTRRLFTRTANIFWMSHLLTRLWEQTNHFHQHILTSDNLPRVYLVAHAVCYP